MRRARARGTASEFEASRIALVATASTSPGLRPAATQKCANTVIAAIARAMPSSPSAPVSSIPAPMRTGS